MNVLMETMTDFLPPISEHPDLAGQALEEETRFPRRCILDRTGTHGLPDPRSPVTSRFRPIIEDDQDAADGAARASRIREKSKTGVDQSKKEASASPSRRNFCPGDPASTKRRSRFNGMTIPHRRVGLMEHGGVGESSGVVRSRCRRWRRRSGYFSPFFVFIIN